MHIIVCVVCYFLVMYSSLTSSPSSIYLMTHTHTPALSLFFNLPLFVAGLQLIQDWLSLPSSQGVGGVLSPLPDAIETPAAVHCWAHVYEGVYVFNSPPMLAFDVSLTCQLTKCMSATPTAKTHHRLANNYVRCKHILIFTLVWTCSGQGNCNYRWSMHLLHSSFCPLMVPLILWQRGLSTCLLGWTWIQTPACCCCCCWCQRHNGAESCIIPFFSLLTASFLQILMLHFVFSSVCPELPK